MKRRRTRRRRGLVPGLALALIAVMGLGCGSSSSPPVVVIGLDGADFDLLMPWMERGDLPNLKALLDQSSIGELQTVYPVLSPVCWTSAVTGVNPGKHGIFDFQKIDAEGDAIIETANSRRALPIWLLLSDAGYRVGVMNVPMSYPPDPVRGDMISGFPFPSDKVNFTYPPDLQAKLQKYPLDYLGLNLFDRTAEEMYTDFLKGQKARHVVGKEWIESGKYDFIWMVFTGTDKVQHFFWKDMDPDHPQYREDSAKNFGDAILDLWKRQDAILGDLLASLPADATVMILSDHGFDAVYKQVNMGNWLATIELNEMLETHAVPPVFLTNGLIHLKLQSELEGSADREAFLDWLIDRSSELSDPKTGLCPFETVARREDIYSGRMVEKGPDIVIQEIPKYMLVKGNPESTDLDLIQDIWSTSFSAHHRPQGILAVRGPGVVARTSGTVRQRLAEGGDFDQASILDVAPTLLALMNQEIPDAMDGRVLDEAVTPESPVRIVPVEDFLLDPAEEAVLSKEEKERLKALPYLQ